MKKAIAAIALLLAACGQDKPCVPETTCSTPSGYVACQDGRETWVACELPTWTCQAGRPVGCYRTPPLVPDGSR